MEELKRQRASAPNIEMKSIEGIYSQVIPVEVANRYFELDELINKYYSIAQGFNKNMFYNNNYVNEVRKINRLKEERKYYDEKIKYYMNLEEETGELTIRQRADKVYNYEEALKVEKQIIDRIKIMQNDNNTEEQRVSREQKMSELRQEMQDTVVKIYDKLVDIRSLDNVPGQRRIEGLSFEDKHKKQIEELPLFNADDKTKKSINMFLEKKFNIDVEFYKSLEEQGNKIIHSFNKREVYERSLEDKSNRYAFNFGDFMIRRIVNPDDIHDETLIHDAIVAVKICEGFGKGQITKNGVDFIHKMGDKHDAFFHFRWSRDKEYSTSIICDIIDRERKAEMANEEVVQITSKTL